jgi:hypothetical protein
MLAKIVDSAVEHFNIVFKQTERSIAIVAKQPANATGSMIMIDRHDLRDAVYFSRFSLPADGAFMSLFFKQSKVMRGLDAELYAQSVLQGVSAILVRILRAVLLGFQTGARLAKTLQPASRAFIEIEIIQRFHCFTCAAPFLAQWHFWTRAKSPIVADNILHWLAFDPSDFFSVARCNWCLLTTSTMAISRSNSG